MLFGVLQHPCLHISPAFWLDFRCYSVFGEASWSKLAIRNYTLLLREVLSVQRNAPSRNCRPSINSGNKHKTFDLKIASVPLSL